jgi:hypothetical protein
VSHDLQFIVRDPPYAEFRYGMSPASRLGMDELPAGNLKARSHVGGELRLDLGFPYIGALALLQGRSVWQHKAKPEGQIVVGQPVVVLAGALRVGDGVWHTAFNQAILYQEVQCA